MEHHAVTFVHPRTWWKDGMRHRAATSERPRTEDADVFFVIAPCHAMNFAHRVSPQDLGAMTCLLCLMTTEIFNG